uniref:Phosphodiesterase n=1 Tax=Albugo laibachii Nc14 TaxID=890382 RepID=F0W263_9STRA|nr:conserved hypothetical protein [Albugo laibachii Nc14]|eukprot:CCA15145.1 conserved hypothetical protein [Albugo laibachii Nc14]
MRSTAVRPANGDAQSLYPTNSLLPTEGMQQMRAPSCSMKRSPMMTSRLLHSNMHPWFCYFYNATFERDYQAFQRRQRNSLEHFYMLALLAVSILFTAATLMQSVGETIDNFFINMLVNVGNVPLEMATVLIKESASAKTSMKFLKTFVSYSCIAYGVALAISIFVWRRKSQAVRLFRVFGIHLDQFQLIFLVFFQFAMFPFTSHIVSVITTLVDGIHQVFADLNRSIMAAGLASAPPSAIAMVQYYLDVYHQTFIVLGLVYLDILYFFLLFVLSLAAGLFRLQYFYFLILAIETTFLILGISIWYYRYFVERWFLFGIYAATVALLLRGAWELDVFCRREYLSSMSLVNENRRLSDQNITMKEELSGKLQYQLHYEMGDILRILCQLKFKIPANDRREIDKIITALVTNEDLFEVTLDASLAEHEEEVQGWLHMMTNRDKSPNVYTVGAGKGNEGQPERQIIQSKRGSTGHNRLSRTVYSRRMSHASDNGLGYENTGEVINELFKEPKEERETLARKLYETISGDSYVDIFQLAEQCESPLQAVLITCLEVNNLISELSLDLGKVQAFAASVENHYFKRNPYHNSLHASAVVADMNFYLRRIHFNLDHSVILIGLIVAAAHDISHPGVSNGFLISTRSKLAITYSDDSILERMHLAELYRILSHEKYDIFSHMAVSAKSEMRKLVIQMILATDLSRLFSHITKLKSKRFAVTEESRGLEVGLIMETLLMLSDLGHTAKPFAYHEHWANRITEEFFRQGEAEERNQLPISPLCDRKQGNLPKSQATFLSLLAMPLFETANEAFEIDNFGDVISDLKGNIRMWQEMIEKGDKSHEIVKS